jgi:hypothetical protein
MFWIKLTLCASTRLYAEWDGQVYASMCFLDLNNDQADNVLITRLVAVASCLYGL